MTYVAEWNKNALLQSHFFEPMHSIFEHIDTHHFPNVEDCNALLETIQLSITTQNGKAVRFVEQATGKLAFEAQYEPRCYLKGEVQTRSGNWHDLFNTLVWMIFPLTKAAINARHYFAMTNGVSGQEGSTRQSQRGAVRDTTTLFDESGVVVPYADDELAALLRGFRWKELFWQRRVKLDEHMGFYIFGHGLYEKALKPYIGLTGQGLLIRVESAFFAWPVAQRLAYIDEVLSKHLDAPCSFFSTRELTPVPLLGIPGWSIENERAEYYDNKEYFRDGRRVR
jgi:hypothetical protein